MNGIEQASKEILNALNSRPAKGTRILALSGGSCSGKTILSREIARLTGASILNMDSYCLGSDDPDHNFDEPAAYDLDLLEKHLKELKAGKPIQKPVYDFKTHSRKGYEEFKPAELIILDGIFALQERFRDHVDHMVFVNSPVQTRLTRRINRDIEERGRTMEFVLKQWQETVTPMHDEHIEPQRAGADQVIENH